MNFQHLSAVAMTVGPGPSGQSGPAGQAGQQPAAQQPATQQPQQPQAPNNGGTNASSSSKKGGCGCVGMVLGCGCLSVLLLSLVGVIGSGIMFWQAPRAVGVDGWGEVAELVETATQAASGANQGFGSSGGLMDGDLSALQGSGAEGEGEEAAAGINMLYNLLDEPTSQRDMDQFRSSMEEWENSEAVRDFQKVVDDALALQDADESLMNAVQMMRTGSQFAFRAKDLGEAYAAHGGDDFAQLHTRFTAIARISQVATEGNQNAWDQAVADALLAEHDENREEYENTRAYIQETLGDESFDPNELTQEEQQELMEALNKQFSSIASAINRDSLEIWADLSERERQDIIEQTEQPHNLIALALSMALSDGGDAAQFLPLLGL